MQYHDFSPPPSRSSPCPCPPFDRPSVNEFPLGCIAPVSILWSPSDAVDSSPSPSTSRTSGAKGEEGMGEDDRAGEDDDDDDDDVRRVWLWVHPAAARETLREIRRACALEGAPWQGSVQVCSLLCAACQRLCCSVHPRVCPLETEEGRQPRVLECGGKQ